MKNCRPILSVLFLFFSSQAFSVNVNAQLETQVIDFLNNYSDKIAAKGYRSDYKVGTIDPRLKLRTCATTLALSFNREPMSQSNVTVLAECVGHKPWKLYLSVQFDIYGTVISSTKAIARGSLITNAMLKENDQIINKVRHTGFSSKRDIVGMIAKRTIRPNMVISPHQIKAPSLIKRGDSVVITAANSAISVSMNGTALGDGMLGQQIVVKNTESKRTVKARVTDKGHVLIAL